MLTLIASYIIAMCVFTQMDGTDTQLQSAGMSPEHLYNGVNRPARITVRSPRSFGTITLALMDESGKPLADSIEVRAGVIDLSEALPVIWTLRRTAYLQIIDGDRAVGSALVLQPMLSRMVPVTEIAPHPVSGKAHTRIVDWVDENELPPPVLPTDVVVEPVAPAPSPSAAPGVAYRPGDRTNTSPNNKGAAGNHNKSDADASADGARSQQPHQVAPPLKTVPTERICTGLRIYTECDVILHTTRGEIRLAMRPEEAPNTVWNFLELCRGGFYRDIEFHRIVPLTAKGDPFVIQAGDPTASGDGGPGYWLPIEDSKLQHDFGVISMARSDDPDSNGSQFFICLSREGTARLDGQYCAFGYAVDGMQTIIDIARSPLADVAAGRAKDPPLIKTADLVPSPPRMLNRGRPDQRISLDQLEQNQPKPTGKIPR